VGSGEAARQSVARCHATREEFMAGPVAADAGTHAWYIEERE
jgi:hypothetical protein